ncbi:MAG TPA: SDR family NAD(P)-dependent oxidoreductase [Paracoccaceae bacterium]|nr:SDR family NAD(P)-dependent oxidoreductase [Paracoccaceae bacterium]
MSKGLAVVTGASSGIGFELARCCAGDGYDLVICADEPEIEAAAAKLRNGVAVSPVNADLATEHGVGKLMQAVGPREIDILIANAGIGARGAFLNQPWEDSRRVVMTNVLGTLALLHRAGGRMRARGKGRVLVTGSIAGHMPGSFNAVYNGSKAYLDNFAFALADELHDSDVTVTCLMPGPTDTEFFERAGIEDTKLATGSKSDPGHVARTGYVAMMRGDREVVPGLMNKIQSKLAGVVPESWIARVHRTMARPGSGE